MADTTFGPPGIGMNGFDSTVLSVTVANGVLLAGGFFSTYRGSLPALGLAVIDLATRSLN